MSGYQYYEFCKLNAPLTVDARKEMHSLSSRAKITTHGASYVYHYGDFMGSPKELLLKYFDIFFYISNFGSIQLMFKYSTQDVEADELKKYCVNRLINYSVNEQHILLDINFTNENGFGWIEGEAMLPDLLPLYDEIKAKKYLLLQLISQNNYKGTASLSRGSSKIVLSPAQEAFFRYAEIGHNN